MSVETPERPHERRAAAKYSPPRGWLSRLSPASKISIGAGFLLVTVVVALQLAPEAERNRPRTAPPATGVACTDLAEAARRYKDNELAFGQAVTAAARAAEHALDTSGEIFGEPERVALELRYRLEDQSSDAQVVEGLLHEARGQCLRLVRWEIG